MGRTQPEAVATVAQDETQMVVFECVAGQPVIEYADDGETIVSYYRGGAIMPTDDSRVIAKLDASEHWRRRDETVPRLAPTEPETQEAATDADAEADR